MAQSTDILTEGTTFLSLQDAEESLKDYAFQYGFQIRREHAKKYTHGPFKGQMKRLIFKCSRAGDHRPRSSAYDKHYNDGSRRVTINPLTEEENELYNDNIANQMVYNCDTINMGMPQGSMICHEKGMRQATDMMHHLGMLGVEVCGDKKRRKTKFSSKCNCPWRVNVNFNQSESAWKITSINNVHNHEVVQQDYSISDKEYSLSRDIELEIMLMLQRNMKLKTILTTMNDHYPDRLISAKHIIAIAKRYRLVARMIPSNMEDSDSIGLSSILKSLPVDYSTRFSLFGEKNFHYPERFHHIHTSQNHESHENSFNLIRQYSDFESFLAQMEASVKENPT
jgi:hypothetical protein